jgi:nucleoside-diphosphate-sugar epimerase
VKVLVTGGSGFLGRHVVARLQSHRAVENILSFGRSAPADLCERGVRCLRGNLGCTKDVERAIRDVDVVFHVGAKAGIWGSRDDYHATNVLGTHNVLKACAENGVRYLIYTSTASVVFTGKDLANVGERIPYGKNIPCDYVRTKMLSEREVLAYNGHNGLKTIALRPHLIVGPGDNHLMPTLLNLARRRRLVRVGNGKNWVDISHVENVADAHILAMDALLRGAPVDGRPYFVTQGDPVCLWEWIGKLLSRLCLPGVRRSVGFRRAYAMGCVCEWLYRRLHIRSLPPMTRFLATELAKDHYFDHSAAKTDLNYIPRITNEEGFERLLACCTSPAEPKSESTASQ